MLTTNYRYPKLGLVCLSILVLSMATVSHARLFATPEFESGETRPVSVAVLPVKVDFTLNKTLGSENLDAEGNEVAKVYLDLVAEELQSKGYKVKSIDSTKANQDSELQELVIDANRALDDLGKKMFSKPGKVKERRYKMGEPAQLLASYLDVDAVVMTRVKALVGRGLANKEISPIGFSLGSTNSVVAINFIDAVSGDVEAMASQSKWIKPKRLFKKPIEQLSKLPKLALEKMPEADGALRKVNESGEEELLSDFEDLLSE